MMFNRLYKILILCLSAILFCFALTGCGNSTDSTTSEPEETTVPAVTSEPTPVPTPEPTPAPTPRPLQDIALATSQIDESFFVIPDERGTIETVEYQTVDYTGSGDPVTKYMCVYLPYGYRENTEYDVIFLMHTMCASERFWFAEHSYVCDDGHTEDLYIPYLIDNMIEKGMCRPLIVVSLCGYIDDVARYERNSARDFEQFIWEFRNDILPYVTANYSVYGTREHIGFMGASFGAYMTYRSILGPCYDLVSYFGLTGGGTIEPGCLFEKWQHLGAQDLDTGLIYIAEGDRDDRGPVELGYMYLAANTDRFNDSNLKFTLFENTAHEFREWDNTLFNCLQLFFRENEA